MKLIGSYASPFVRKVRIVMAEKKLDYHFVLEDVFSKDSTIQTVNPLGKIPCLVMDDGEVIFDSSVIVEYLDTRSPVSKLIPINGRERIDVRCWEALADGILDAGVLIRLERILRHESMQNADWIARQQRKIEAGLHTMEIWLGDKAYCSGPHFMLSDIAVGCTLGWLDFRFEHITWRKKYTALAKLFDKLSERPSFKETMP